jgi:two-component system CheB/CheR fusion protein
VLVVDDCPETAEGLAGLLAAWGHEPRVALDGPDALRDARDRRPDVVLLDVELPGMDGHEVARRLRGEIGLGEALIVMLTGHGTAADRRRSGEAGCDFHLVKPVDLAELQELLSRDPLAAGA